MTELKPKRIVIFGCPLCPKVYTTRAEATACIARGEEEVFCEVGDFVTEAYDESGRYGWFDGDPEWVVTIKEPGVGARGEYNFIYIVTLITADRDDGLHRKLVHVATMGYVNSNEKGKKFRGGWTSRGHIRMKKLDLESVPEKVRDAAGQFLGMEFGLLM